MMKHSKRFLCLLLTLILAASLCVFPAAAADQTCPSSQDDPVVFVHGLMGWGQRAGINAVIPYWGMTTGSLTSYLNSLGYETYSATVGPISSAWDRACELYAQLTGTTVDYGAAHAAAHDHARYGITYDQPLFSGWGTKRAVNLVGHSFGGATTRQFLELMANGSVTRAQFVTFLAGLAGVNVSAYQYGPFSDVPADAWYAPYVNWAAANHIVSGTSATTFDPNATISRQDMAVMLYNYAQRYDVTLNEQAVTPFTDESAIADYALSAVQALHRAGVISGMPDGSFQPYATATREQACTMLCML